VQHISNSSGIEEEKKASKQANFKLNYKAANLWHVMTEL
jgi:hypothetical protein